MENNNEKERIENCCQVEAHAAETNLINMQINMQFWMLRPRAITALLSCDDLLNLRIRNLKLIHLGRFREVIRPFRNSTSKSTR